MNKVGEITLPSVRAYFSKQGSGVLARDRHIDQWNRIENSELDPTDFWHRGERNSVEKGWPFQKMVLEQLHIHKQKNELSPKPHTLYKN